MQEVQIRDAQSSDAHGIQRVFHDAWLATYPNDAAGITREDMEAFFKDAYSEESMAEWEKIIATIGTNHAFLVAESEGEIVGVCRAFVRPHENRLQAIYVLPGHQGEGIGKMLFRGLDGFFDRTKDIVVDVAEYNARAYEFYARLGFEKTGKSFKNERFKMPVSGNIIPEIEMRKKRG